MKMSGILLAVGFKNLFIINTFNKNREIGCSLWIEGVVLVSPLSIKVRLANVNTCRTVQVAHLIMLLCNV